MLTYSEKTKRSRLVDKMWQRTLKGKSANDASKKSHCITSDGHYLYGFPESADDSRVKNFIYCIMPKKITENMTVCVLHLLQRKIINRKYTRLRYEYASSLLYMKLPS
jgi:hypothetical protein